MLILNSHFPHKYKGGKGHWLNSEEAEYAKLRIKYANGPNPPTYQFRWKDVTAALKDSKTWFM